MDPSIEFRTSNVAKKKRSSSPPCSPSTSKRARPFIVCMACEEGLQSFSSWTEFAEHLTAIHYRERILSKLNRYPPFKCDRCSYETNDSGSPESQREDLMMHVGVKEGVALKYYRDEHSQRKQLACELCGDRTFDDEEKLMKHLVKRHLTKELAYFLPQHPPFKCPDTNCKESKKDFLSFKQLALHYGIQHGAAKKLYEKKKLRMKNTTTTSSPCATQSNDHIRNRPSPSPSGFSSPSSASPSLSLSSRVPPQSPSAPYQSSPCSPSVNGARKEQYRIPKKSCNTLPSRPPSSAKSSSSSLISDPTINRAKSSTTSRLLHCAACGPSASFKVEAALNQHLLFYHFLSRRQTGGPFTCNECRSMLSDKTTYVTHFIDKHKDVFDRKKEELYNTTSKTTTSSNNNTASRVGKTGEATSPQNKQLSFSSAPKQAAMSSTVKKRKNGDGVGNGAHAVSSKQGKEKFRSQSRDPRGIADKTTRAGPSSTSANTSNIPKVVPKTPTVTSIDAGLICNSTRILPVPSKPSVGARQRLIASWEQGSLEGQGMKVQELEEKLETIRKEYESALEAQRAEYEKLLSEKDAKFQSEQNLRSNVEKELNASRETESRVTKRWEESSETLSKLSVALTERAKQIDELSAQNKQLERDLADMRIDHLKKAHEDENREQVVNEMKTLLHTTRDELNAKDEELDALKDEFANLKKQLEKSEKQSELKQSRLQKQIDQQKTKSEKLNEEKKEKVNELRELTKVKKEMEDLCNKSQEEVSQLEKEKQRLLETLERQQRTIEGREEVIKAKTKVAKELKDKLDDTEANLDAAMQALKTSKEDLNKLKKEIKQVRSQSADFEGRQITNLALIGGLQKEREEMMLKLKRYEENGTEAQNKLYEEEQVVKQQKKDIENLKNELELAKKRQQVAEGHADSVKNDFVSLMDRNSGLEKKLKELCSVNNRNAAKTEQGVEALKEEVKNREEEMKHLKITLREKERKIVSLTNDNKAASKKLTDQAEENNRLAIEVKEIRQQFDQLRNGRGTVDSNYNTLNCSAIKKTRNPGPRKSTKNSMSSPGSATSSSSMTPPQNAYTPFEKVGKLEPSSGVNTIIDASNPLVLNGIDVAAKENGLNAPPSSSTSNDVMTEDDEFVNVDQEESTGVSGHLSLERTASMNAMDDDGLPDVTGKVVEDNEKCGICQRQEPQGSTVGASVDWVGCDCGRWFHKTCTKMKRFKKSFTCKSVRLVCLVSKNDGGNYV